MATNRFPLSVGGGHAPQQPTRHDGGLYESSAYPYHVAAQQALRGLARAATQLEVSGGRPDLHGALMRTLLTDPTNRMALIAAKQLTDEGSRTPPHSLSAALGAPAIPRQYGPQLGLGEQSTAQVQRVSDHPDATALIDRQPATYVIPRVQ